MTNKNIVIVDIDGTISEVGERLKYLKQDPPDWDSFYDDCFEDEPIEEMVELVYALFLQGYELVFCTGRRESCREKTLSWLYRHFEPEVPASSLLIMRPNGDYRHDTAVKPAQIQLNGISFDSIAFVLEDRDSMVGKWRELGVRCLQVAKGDF